MNPNQTSAGTAKTSAGSRAERPNERPGKPSLRTRARNLIARVRSRLDRPASFAAALLDKVPVLGAFLRLRVAWVLLLFVVGFAAGTAWQSYGDGAGRSGTAYERVKAMSLALATARKNLDKLASDLSRLEAQGLDAPQRRSAR